MQCVQIISHLRHFPFYEGNSGQKSVLTQCGWHSVVQSPVIFQAHASNFPSPNHLLIPDMTYCAPNCKTY